MGVDGRNTVNDSLRQEQIYFGDTTDPAVAKHADQWAGKQVLTGDQARAFALVMREHALEASGGMTYAQMGRYQSAANPSDAKGTNDEAAAAKDPSGAPLANAARNTWVTETALSTALNVSYMAEQRLRVRHRRRCRPSAHRHRADDPGAGSARRAVPRGGRRAGSDHDEVATIGH